MLLNTAPLALQETTLRGFTTVTNTKDYQPQGTDLELIIFICTLCSLFSVGPPPLVSLHSLLSGHLNHTLHHTSQTISGMRSLCGIAGSLLLNIAFPFRQHLEKPQGRRADPSGPRRWRGTRRLPAPGSGDTQPTSVGKYARGLAEEARSDPVLRQGPRRWQSEGRGGEALALALVHT